MSECVTGADELSRAHFRDTMNCLQMGLAYMMRTKPSVNKGTRGGQGRIQRWVNKGRIWGYIKLLQ